MGKKCRKLLALLTMFAMIVTYSFSASIVSVYADDEQGDVNAKAVASEEYGVGFLLGNTALRDEVQKTLEDMAADGTMKQISEKWFGSDVTIIGK